MLYLLDANTLIDAKRNYYPIDRVPEFWDWLVYLGRQKTIKIPREIYEEFSDTKDKHGNKDKLAEWAEQQEIKEALLFAEEVDRSLVNKIVYEGYTPEPTDEDIRKVGRDPFLISYALRDIENRTIVTTEISKPKKKGANRKIPDVCQYFGIRCINTFQMIDELDFSTSWNSQV
ncbi:MAG: DUF4411 family protein [Candidatus Aminicenantes bacterium]